MASQFSKQPVMHCADCGETHPRRDDLNPSPFHSLSVQERMPDASETAAIRDFIEDTDTEMTWREEAIRRLQCEIAELRRHSEHHKAIIAPIRRIPPEILAEIFLQLTSIEENTTTAKDTTNFTPKPRNELPYWINQNYMMQRPLVHRAPLLFCEISRKWRAIALSVPRLWNSLSLQCRAKKLTTSVPLCEMWLKRSGSLPLSIRLYPRRYGFVHRPFEDSEDLVNTILPFAARWRFLDLDGLRAPSYNALRCVFSNSVPILEALSVCHGMQEYASTLRKLCRLYFDKVGAANIVTQQEQATFPWSQLTHIDVGDCSVDDCLQILNQASAAIDCRFAITRPSQQAHHASILLSELRILKIQVVSDSSAISLDPWWSCLTCTALSTLFVSSDISQGLPSFIMRSGKTIEDFTLTISGLDDDQFMSCLAKMPFLRRLKVSETGTHWQFANQVWESLTWAAATDSPPPLIPKLESLELTGGVYSSHKDIVRMLKSRLGRPDCAVPELKVVTLSFWRNLSESAYQKLLAFQELGVKMAIDSGVDDDEAGSEASDTEEETGSDSDESEEGESED
ncbi:hypothetical protein B0H12DRAFT_1106143 [Mycena haematopus]|nr:hypothetical protein B0H12DRAFT_1106143 [Mycena haematopus]